MNENHRNEDNNNPNNRRQAIIAEVQALLTELAGLDIDEDGNDPLPRPRGDQLGPGVHVQVIRQDEYFGRTGTIVDRRGTHYWNVRLDLLATETRAKLIYKTGRYLRAVPHH